jgi:NAD(P)-dependent dehydrogenase (short-subunit alcohol dehydrogenase family)
VARPRLHGTLEGQVALVTGASRGIGRAVAQGLASAGATVFAGARDPREAPQGSGLRPVRLDVDSPAERAAAIEAVAAGPGRLDILVNNAAVAAEWGEGLLEADDAEVEATLRTNALSAVLLTKRALPLLLERPGGRVVNVSSGVGAFAEAYAGAPPAYMVSKAALNSFTLYLHLEYGRRGLLANAVCPGWVRTDMGGEGADRSVEEGADTPIWLAKFAEGSPGGLFWRDRKPIAW